MRAYIVRDERGNIHNIKSTLGARQHYELYSGILNTYLFWLTFFALFSPLFFFIVLIYFFIDYNNLFHKVFFKNKRVIAKYKEFLAPTVATVGFSAVGYRIYPEELDEHLYIINSNDKADIKTLINKAKKMRKNPTRQFVFDVDKLCRHLFYLGTTGSGKSETIMSFFTNVVQAGGGIGFIDGKSDVSMEGRIYNLCRENYYETQFNVINFSSPEQAPDSNTYAPLLSYPSAMKASEFLGEYIGGGEGNADYFAGRSKVMLGNNIRHFKNRQYYYNENFSFSDVAQSRNHIEMTYIFSSAYGICLEIEERITKKLEESIQLQTFMNKARGLKTPQLDEIENLEMLHEYLNQNPTAIPLIEKELDMKFEFVSNYFNLYDLIGKYIEGVSPSWQKYTIALSKAFKALMTIEGKKYLYDTDNPVQTRDLRQSYVAFKRANEKLEAVEEHFNKTKQSDILNNLLEAVGTTPKDENGKRGATKESLEKLDATALQQHQYALQGWDRLFDLFASYQRIMGVIDPDVDGEDIITNNKVLFVMLPATELATDLVESLGKLIILMFKNIASISLGGAKQTLMSVQFKIYQNKIKPNPIFLMVTDEIGSYMPKNGLSLIASQVRSLNISLIIAGQDVVSVEPNGADGKRERARLMANLAKIILQTRDSDTVELEKLIPEVEVLETDGYIQSAVNDLNYLSKNNASVKKVKVFDIGVATKFAKGFGAYLDGAREEPIYFQSYYLGDNIKYALQVRKSVSFRSLYNEYEVKNNINYNDNQKIYEKYKKQYEEFKKVA